MQVQLDIEFDQILKMVKALPPTRQMQLKAAIEKKNRKNKIDDLEAMLLKGPTATKKQLEIISKNRKAINQWRTK